MLEKNEVKMMLLTEKEPVRMVNSQQMAGWGMLGYNKKRLFHYTT